MPAEKKICPIMSRPVLVGKIKLASILGIPLGVVDGDMSQKLKEVPCQRERCMAWAICDFADENEDCPAGCVHPGEENKWCCGYCRLLERGEHP